MTKYFAGSRFIHTLTTYNKNYFENSISDPNIEHFMTTPSFGGIYYDPFKKYYYRLALLPAGGKNQNYDIKNAPTKQISIIVLNERFHYLGELLLEKNKYSFTIVFVSKAGLNFQNHNRKENTKDFTTFSFK